VVDPVRGRHYDQFVPIYEFDCSACGARFERLVDAGTERAACAECGAEDATRLLSSFAAPVRQMTANQRRRAEDKRSTDRGGARTRFKQSLARARGKDGSGKRRPGRTE
jgi:putative FmdB family regulatory protein